MFDKVLIANRGEIALRIQRACKELGIATVAVHSTADADAMHVRLADESVCIGPPPAAESYLNIPRLLAACEITGADAVHPGYGFLSENARFAEILEEHQITFIGPTSEHIRIMGDKIEAKETAKKLGIPVVPGSDGAVTSEPEAMKIAKAMGFPVLIKATAGGGGRGMKVAQSPADLGMALSTARAEAKAAFGNDQVYMEKYLTKPRHIEIQVLGDGQGNAVHLGERDCSLQRRHQKILEESPSPALNEAARQKIGETVAVGHAQDQVPRRRHGGVPVRGRRVLFHRNEHPSAGGASGHRGGHGYRSRARADPRRLRRAALRSQQKDITFSGHAIECRINAENPRTFRPSPGADHLLASAGRPRRARRQRRLPGLPNPAVLRQPHRQADRARQEPQRMPDASASAHCQSSSSTASRRPSRCSTISSASRTSPTVFTISIGSKSISPSHSLVADAGD